MNNNEKKQHRSGITLLELSTGVKGFVSKLLIWQLDKQVTVIPASEVGIFWQTPTVLEEIPASAGMTILGSPIARVIKLNLS